MKQRRISFGLLCLMVSLWLPQTAASEEWLLVETRHVPNDCAHPLICLPKSEVAGRHLINMSQKGRRSFFEFLNTVSSVAGIPDSAITGLHPPDATALHDLEISPKLRPLINHPGVYFDSTALDDGEFTSDFSTAVRGRLEALGLRLLTKEEWQQTPGRPTLSIRFTARLESAGCIVPFAVYMTLKEEVVLVRDPTQKITATIWSGSRRQNLASVNYGPNNAIREVLERFETDWRKANRAG